MFNCPSKRPLQGHPLDATPGRTTLAYNSPACTLAAGCRVARGDYRVNSGSVIQGDEPGPPLFTSPAAFQGGYSRQNGISYQKSTVRIARITDGTSKTALVGEKYLNPDHYFDGAYTADDQCLFSGHDNDNNGYMADGDAVNRPSKTAPAPTWTIPPFRQSLTRPASTWPSATARCRASPTTWMMRCGSRTAGATTMTQGTRAVFKLL